MSNMILHECGLEFHAIDGEPRIRDLDLAEKLGYERPRKIRDLIAEFANEIEVCPVQGRTSERGGRPADEYWLTEAQALFVVAKSETSKATEILKLVISAFIAVRKQIERDEQALKTIPRRLLEAFLLPKPTTEWERMFQPSLVKAICDLHGDKWSGGPHPRWMSSTNSKIYTLVFSSAGAAEIKRRNPLPKWGSNHHQHLTAEARDYFSAQLKIVEALARQSANKVDFWRRMEREFAESMLQLPLGGTAA